MIISCLLQTTAQCLATKTKCKQHSQVHVERAEIKKETRGDSLRDASGSIYQGPIVGRLINLFA